MYLAVSVAKASSRGDACWCLKRDGSSFSEADPVTVYILTHSLSVNSFGKPLLLKYDAMEREKKLGLT